MTGWRVGTTPPGKGLKNPDLLACEGAELAARDYVLARHPSMDRDQKERRQRDALHGWEIVDRAARLCAMNLYLRSIGGDKTNTTVDDSLRVHPGVNYDLVLTNPPFGRKSSLTFVNSEGETERETLTVERPDFWATTSNKQLNFLQHVRTLLKNTGRAAIVVPDRRGMESATAKTPDRDEGKRPPAVVDECPSEIIDFHRPASIRRLELKPCRIAQPEIGT